MEPARIGLIGCGGIARSAHLPAIAHLSGLVRLVAAADVRAEAARSAAAPFGADAYTDYRQVLARRDVDMVILCTPEYAHREQVEAAAAAGKHVLSEKPMARTLAEADAMIDAARRAGVRLMIGHSRRFTGRYQQVRRAIDAGEIGEVRVLRENERRSRPPAGEAGTYWTPEHWTGDPSRSVGAVLTNGIHEADLFRWFAGAEPVRVFAEHKTTRPGSLVPDFITFTVEFANGAVASAEVSNCLPPGYPSYHQLEIHGTRGSLRARDHDQQALMRYRDGGTDHPDSYHLLLHVQDAYVSELAQFVKAWREDRPVPLPAEEAREALRLALAADQSARTGRAVDLTAGAAGAQGGRRP
jgi:predicted dehydrogenase